MDVPSELYLWLPRAVNCCSVNIFDIFTSVTRRESEVGYSVLQIKLVRHLDIIDNMQDFGEFDYTNLNGNPYSAAVLNTDLRHVKQNASLPATSSKH